MKGFPNQIADLSKIVAGMRCLDHLIADGVNAKDDGVFGAALVREGILGTGHNPKPVETYLTEQRLKPISGQSFRTTARGLRELYRLLGFIDDSNSVIVVSSLGHQAVVVSGNAPLNGEQIHFWRRVIRNMSHYGGDAEASHPYQMLLRLIARKPGITRAMCALAFEARNDSEEELNRIVELAAMSEGGVRDEIEVSKSNWDNAKKVLPKFAEQLGDVIKTGNHFELADAPGLASDPSEVGRRKHAEIYPGRRPPRNARQVTPLTIARAGTEERSDEVEVLPEIDSAAVAEAVRVCRDRLRRHNLLVQALARCLPRTAQLFEGDFDLFAVIESVGILLEIKTLDGTAADERDRVRDALAQLLYYEAFFTPSSATDIAIRKIACFEGPIGLAHRDWLNRSGIAVIWQEGGRFRGDALAVEFVRDYVEELR